MKTTLKIEGMHCSGCVRRIENILKKVDGIKKFEICLEEKNIILEVEKESILNLIKEKINDLGFKVVE